MVVRIYRTEVVRNESFIVGTKALLACKIEVELEKRNIDIFVLGKELEGQLQVAGIGNISKIVDVVMEQGAPLQNFFIEIEET